MPSLIKEKITVNDLTLHNRLVMPPMATHMSNDNGDITDELLNYYDEKTKGGYIGLVITEHTFVSQEGKASDNQLSIADDKMIPELKKIVDIIHKNGSKVFSQINHAGSSTDPSVTGSPTMSSSAVKPPRTRPIETIPCEMGGEDIKKVISDFTAAAIRTKEAGYDGVEIHSAHGYLLNQFYSPLTNKRTDAYTGSTMEGRLRLHLEILNSIRKAVGEYYPIALRLGACDYKDGGSVIADGVKAAKCFEKAGLDLLDISGGFCGYLNPHNTEQGYFSDITEAIKKECSIPVILTGGITDIEIAEKLLEDKKADFIGVGRAILKDSSWAKKALTEIG